jgi:hypothetical protein
MRFSCVSRPHTVTFPATLLLATITTFAKDRRDVAGSYSLWRSTCQASSLRGTKSHQEPPQ